MFTKKNQSVTYLVFTNDDAVLVGYFTIAIKPITVNTEKFSNTIKRKIARVSELDEETGTYTLSAYLIAQLGKNFADGANELVTGKQLLQFYEEQNGFKRFDTRETRNGIDQAHTSIQLLTVM